jgi:hypothetical protein
VLDHAVNLTGERGWLNLTLAITPNLPDNNVFNLRVEDRYGNAYSLRTFLTLDLTAPSFDLVDPPNGALLNVSAPTLRFQGDADIVGLSVQGEAAAFDGTYWVWSGTFGQGRQVVTAEAVDPAGNRRAVTFDFTIDTVAPVLVFHGIVDGMATNRPNITVTVAQTPGVDVFFDGRLLWGPPGDLRYTAELPLGESHHALVGRDAAGNTVRHDFAVTYDPDPPEATVLSPAANATGVLLANRTVVAITLQVSADAREVRLASDAWAPGAGGTLTIELPLAEGPHVLEFTVEDWAGNVAGYTFTLVVDTTAPRLRSVDPANGSYYLERFAIVLVAMDEPGHVRAAGNAIPAPMGQARFTLGLTEGANTFLLELVDEAGNVREVVYRLRGDFEGPVLEVSRPTDGFTTTEGVVRISGVTEPGATVTVNGLGVPVRADGSFDFDLEIEPGYHELRVVARDEAGHTVIYGASVVREPGATGAVEALLTAVVVGAVALAVVAWFGLVRLRRLRQDARAQAPRRPGPPPGGGTP